jgi:hypothetical protein
MLPISPWLQAMEIEANLPRRPAQPTKSTHAGRRLRRAVGRTLIAIGNSLAGTETVAARTVSVGR